jgi:hypothetical protein
VGLHISPHGSQNISRLKSPFSDGGPVLRDLLFRRRQCVFIAFDLLYLNEKDLRTLSLIAR